MKIRLWTVQFRLLFKLGISFGVLTNFLLLRKLFTDRERTSSVTVTLSNQQYIHYVIYEDVLDIRDPLQKYIQFLNYQIATELIHL